jgi:hypothetical protein
MGAQRNVSRGVVTVSQPGTVETRDRHPTPPLIAFASTLPLEGRVRKDRPQTKSPKFANSGPFSGFGQFGPN